VASFIIYQTVAYLRSDAILFWVHLHECNAAKQIYIGKNSRVAPNSLRSAAMNEPWLTRNNVHCIYKNWMELPPAISRAEVTQTEFMVCDKFVLVMSFKRSGK